MNENASNPSADRKRTEVDPLDQVLFNLDAEQFSRITALLDASSIANEGLLKLLSVIGPWESSK